MRRHPLLVATTHAHYVDFAGLLKLETKSGDPCAHLFEGLVRGCRVGQRTGTVGHKFTGEGLQGYGQEKCVGRIDVRVHAAGYGGAYYRVSQAGGVWGCARRS
ncbi:major outer sheath C-terminal domain-containing protein [Treponema paraluiscuniculi]|uniref:major outer sheath C-terminal domain-containing protein n=1 Tax=Treponema paraluiscuniculi TaxID=53435 RepID=UPI001427D71C